MGFSYIVNLPGFNKKIQAHEISARNYRELVKSLYNNDSTAFIQHLSDIIEIVSPGIQQEGLNVVDKIILLLHMRAICISPDLKLETKCPETKKGFETVIKIETLIETLEKVQYNKVITHDNIQIFHSIIKVKDELQFIDIEPEKLFINQLASCVDSISIQNNRLDFVNLTFEKRIQIIEKLPLILTTKIFESIANVEEQLSKTKLLVLHSPFGKKPVIVDLPVSTDTKVLLEFCKLIFNDDLGNLYMINYNLTTKANFNTDYIDQITPAEQLLYWSYFIMQTQQEQDNAKGDVKNNPMFGGRPLKGLNETASEFTG